MVVIALLFYDFAELIWFLLFSLLHLSRKVIVHKNLRINICKSPRVSKARKMGVDNCNHF